jgi:glycosyltransferase involved in cell wall biosynthesis
VKLSVIVPAFNEEKLIAASLHSIRQALAAVDRLGWAHELIVCDNNSTDRTAELACRAGARVVFEPVNQISRARNTGAAAATGDWLLFVDADSYPSPELLADMAEAIQSGRCLAGGSTMRMDLDRRHYLERFSVGLWNRLSRTLRWLAGAFIFCEAAAFRELGGFNQELFASEEIELSRRLKQRARGRSRQIVILHRHPLRTSGRKVTLYTPWEWLGFLAKLIGSRGQRLRDRSACPMWYDGRR